MDLTRWMDFDNINNNETLENNWFFFLGEKFKNRAKEEILPFSIRYRQSTTFNWIDLFEFEIFFFFLFLFVPLIHWIKESFPESFFFRLMAPTFLLLLSSVSEKNRNRNRDKNFQFDLKMVNEWKNHLRFFLFFSFD